MVFDWFHSLALGSISNFVQLNEKFLECFASSIRIKKYLMEHLSMEQCEETLCQWYEHFTKVTKQIKDITPHKKIAAFQRGIHGEEFLKMLIIDLPTNFADLVV